jgi:hypothetical protein
MEKKHFIIKNFCNKEEVESILLYHESLDESKNYCCPYLIIIKYDIII